MNLTTQRCQPRVPLIHVCFGDVGSIVVKKAHTKTTFYFLEMHKIAHLPTQEVDTAKGKVRSISDRHSSCPTLSHTHFTVVVHKYKPADECTHMVQPHAQTRTHKHRSKFSSSHHCFPAPPSFSLTIAHLSRICWF